MKHILASNPNIDLRIVFQNPNQKISKGSKTTYESYAIKIGIKHIAKKDMPEDWLKECCKEGETPITTKFFAL